MIRNLFRRRSLLTPAEYQQRVLEVLRCSLPGADFAATDEPLIVRNGGIQYGLQNLYSAYIRDGVGPRQRDERIRTHFARMVHDMEAKEDVHSRAWLEVERLIRPQFMPAEYAAQVPLVALPFTDDVSIGIVIDSEATYSYVRQEDLPGWALTEAALLEVAVANLSALSANVEMQYCDGADKWLAVEVRDGYDAARLLVPGVRAAATERLGSPCFAAIPNRDFLFFWSAESSLRFHRFAREKTLRDCETQPYGLTATLFSATDSQVSPWPDA